jgi:hypothetical protein
MTRSPTGSRPLPTRLHGMLDYALGGLLMAAPWLLGFAHGGAETIVPVLLGAAMLGYSICTDYELGVARLIPMRAHLALDLGGGALLALSPWLFGFDSVVRLPHLWLGLLGVGLALRTRKRPSYMPPRRGNRPIPLIIQSGSERRRG